MDVKARIYLIKIIEKYEKNKKFSEKLGVINSSKFKYEKFYDASY